MLIKTDDNQKPIRERDQVEWTRDQTIGAEKAHIRREEHPFTPDGNGMDVTNAEQRMGRPMSAWSIQQKLQKIRPFLVFERSNADPSKTGIYLQSPVYDPFLYKGRLQFVCGMESGLKQGHNRFIPEFSIIEPRYVDVPDPGAEGGTRKQRTMKCEIRGWRSVLAVLLKYGILSAHDIEKHFQISLGRDSQKWQEMLQGEIQIETQQPTEVFSNVRTEDPATDSTIAGAANGPADMGSDHGAGEGVAEAG